MRILHEPCDGPIDVRNDDLVSPVPQEDEAAALGRPLVSGRHAEDALVDPVAQVQGLDLLRSQPEAFPVRGRGGGVGPRHVRTGAADGAERATEARLAALRRRFREGTAAVRAQLTKPTIEQRFKLVNTATF